MATKWVVLVYKLPPEPSAPRVAVWRALKRLEGRYLVDGAFAVKASEANVLAIRQLAHDVRNYGGDALVLDVADVDDERAMRPMADDAPPARGKRARPSR